MADPAKAVFLSYASQDAEAAKRICEALRAAGVEVWFDQSELVGGDQWDAKIRGQISSCALFVPIISAATQARLEGYFRIEWKLAARRTHAMAAAKAFLFPVVIDATRDAEAHVPDEFREVQWTKLPGGESPPAFCERVMRLVGGSDIGASLDDARGSAAADGRAQGAPLQGRRPRWLAPVIAGAVVAVLALVLTRPWEKAATSAELSARRSAPTTAAPSEARQLVAKAWVLLNKPEMARAELDAADALCKRAAAIDATDPEVWAAWSHVNVWYCFHNLDRSAPRQEAAREYASRAMQLDPKSYEARLAQAFYWVRGDATGRRLGEAQSLLRELLRERPDEPRVLFTLGYSLIDVPETETEGVTLLERLARNPGFAAVAWDEIGWAAYFNRDWAKAEAAIAQSLAVQPYWNNLGLKITMAERVHGDMDLAESALKQMPASALQEDWGIGFACEVYQWRREPLRTIEVLEGVSRDWIHYFFYDYPKAYLLGEARLMAKQAGAARRDFQRARVLIEKQLADDPNNGNLLGLQARTLLYLGEREEAEKSYRLVKELGGTDYMQIWFAPPEAAIAFIRSMAEAPQGEIIGRTFFSAASLRLDPHFDQLRPEPAFQALLAQREAGSKPAAPSPSTLSLSPSTPPDAKSVAVLAFANLSDDKANEYFSDGISEELLNVLAKIPDLKVAARTSAFYFKGKEVPIPEIAQKLGVAYVVEGSVRKQGDKVRITAQLVKAADGFHVWSDTFTRDLKDIFAMQDEIAGLIARNISPVLNPPMASASRVLAPEAVQEYLAGRAAAARAGMADLREAVTHFDRVVAVEPKFTAAWVQLATAHTRLGRWGGTPTLQAWQAARAAIDHARSLEPDSPEVLLALGWILRTVDWDWRGAEEAFRRTLQLQPNQPDALTGAAVLLFNIGKTEEAFRLGQQAAQLDPLNASTQIDLSLMFFFSGNWAEAERSARRALQLAPGGASYHSILAWSLFKQERYAEAEAETALESDDVEQATAYGILAIVRGQGAAAREQLARLEEISRTRGDSADLQQSIAWIYASLGEKDHAFAALEKARTSRDPSMSWLRNSWFLQPLFTDPRWSVLLHQVGLADDQLK
jgi:TolB-like protein/Flp pilus assembly protein TadD